MLYGCVVSVCCVGFASFDVVYDEHGLLVSSSFLISVCMLVMSKYLLIWSAIVIVLGGGAIWLNSFATLCSTVNVGCCVLYPCCMGVFGMLAVAVM